MIDTYRLGRRCTNTGTSASAITSDSDLGGPSGAERVERGCDVQIASGTIKGGTTRIAGTPVLSTGTFNVDPNLTGALAAADLFDILYRPLRFTKGEHVMEAAINAALRRFAWEKRIVPLTLCPDGDMLAAGTTSWSEVGGGALSKVVEAFPYGLPALRMTGVAANDYIQSTAMAVEPEKSYYLEVLGLLASTAAAADTGTLVLYDVTNAASITLDTDQITINRFEPTILINGAVEMPSGCKQVYARFEADNAGDIIDWGWVILRKNEDMVFTVQDRPTRLLALGEVRATTTDDWGRRSWDDMAPVTAKSHMVQDGMWQYHLGQSVSGLSVWYEETVATPVIDALTDTTSVKIEHLAAVATERLLYPLRSSPAWALKYEEAARDAAAVLSQRKSQIPIVHTGNRYYSIPYA